MEEGLSTGVKLVKLAVSWNLPSVVRCRRPASPAEAMSRSATVWALPATSPKSSTSQRARSSGSTPARSAAASATARNRGTEKKASRRAVMATGPSPDRILRPRSVTSKRDPRPATSPKSRALATLVRYAPLLVPLYPSAGARMSPATAPPAESTRRATSTAADRSYRTERNLERATTPVSQVAGREGTTALAAVRAGSGVRAIVGWREADGLVDDGPLAGWGAGGGRRCPRDERR